MDPGTCDVNETFTMRVLESEDFSTPDDVYIKAEKLAINDKLEELNEISLFDKDEAIMERRKTIKEENRVDGLSAFTKNYFICQEIIVDELHYDDYDISDNIIHSIEIDIEKGLKETEKTTDNFFIQDADPQLEKQSVSDLGKKFPSRLPDEQILTHTEKALLEWNRNQFTSKHKVLNFSAEPEKQIILQSQSELPNEVNLLRCVDCNFDFRRKVSLRSHSSLSNKENAFKCGYCINEPNTTGVVPKNAVKRSRTQTYTKDFKCYQCGEIFLLKSSLDNHLLNHENKKPFECPVCCRKFTRKCNLLAHACKVLKSQEKVQDIPKSKANQPRKVLKKNSFPNFNLQAQNSKSRNKTFWCSECGKKFSNNWNLNRHSFTHSSVKQNKTFRCSECGKNFSNKSNRNRHTFTHSNVRQNKIFGCSECDKKFVDKWHLNRHSLTHSSVKQIKNSKSRNKIFGCSECDKKFSAKSQLNRHNLTHSGVKPYECKYCNKRFLRKDYLSQHISTHTGEKSYKCKQCNVKFVFGSSLSRHIHRFHLKT